MGAVRRSILVAATATTLAMTPGTALGAPAEHFEEDVVGEELACGDPPYVIVAGLGRLTLREGSSASGNQSFSVTFTPHHVVLENVAGNRYDLRGAAHFGGSYNATRDTAQHTGTIKLQLVEHASGRVENVNQTIHFTTVNGNVKDFSFGTCRLEFQDED